MRPILILTCRGLLPGALLLVCLCAPAPGPARAADKPGPTIWADYPYRYRQHEGFKEMSALWVQRGVKHYRAIYGRWPEHWGDVLQEGLFQVPLYTPYGDGVIPDDGSFDFRYDVVYRLSENGVATIDTNTYLNDPAQIFSIDLTPEGNYESLLTELAKKKPESDAGIILGYPRYYKQLALTGMLFCSIQDYREVYGSYPDNIPMLLKSHVGAFDEHSLNPLTGGPFMGDGTPMNWVYTRYAEDAFNLKPVLGDGTIPRLELAWDELKYNVDR